MISRSLPRCIPPSGRWRYICNVWTQHGKRRQKRQQVPRTAADYDGEAGGRQLWRSEGCGVREPSGQTVGAGRYLPFRPGLNINTPSFKSRMGFIQHSHCPSNFAKSLSGIFSDGKTSRKKVRCVKVIPLERFGTQRSRQQGDSSLSCFSGS